MNFGLEELTWSSFKGWLREQYVGVASPLMGAERQLQMKYSVGEDFESFAWRFRDLYLEWQGNSTESEISQALVDRLPEEATAIAGVAKFSIHKGGNCLYE
ncbi:hypothetical protein AVEN_145699-1 [Araneus ventricosus]|uniref:Retrotransposon gag domain-containing protein n=1 Tax=Araneus ventricosus TaxID=182803 RepID=A0A4Y1ZJM0_ARAVE|nr:hypothetical protein AVEN_145699-1 [Araneus ventricosus]